MRKFNTILLILICSLLSTQGHGKIAGNQAIAIPVIQKVSVQQNAGTDNAATLFDDTLIPPLLIFMVVPT